MYTEFHTRLGTPPKPELSSRGWAPYSTGLPSYMSVPGTHQLVVLQEAEFSFSKFFLKTLSMHLPISWWVIYECTWPHYTDCSAVFDQKRRALCPYSPILLKQLFVSPNEKSPQRDIFYRCERGQKMAEALKGIKIDEFKQFWAVEKTYQ